MFARTVRSALRRRNLLKASPQTFVARAAQLMAAKNVGAILVVDDGDLVGIITERDVVFRVVARGLDPQTTMVAAVMTRSPVTIAPDQPLGVALTLMHEKGFRHLPVVEHGKPIGVVSARSAMDPDLEEFASEAHRREYFQARA
jgi:CBS domain-containing protein